MKSLAGGFRSLRIRPWTAGSLLATRRRHGSGPVSKGGILGDQAPQFKRQGGKMEGFVLLEWDARLPLFMALGPLGSKSLTGECLGLLDMN